MIKVTTEPTGAVTLSADLDWWEKFLGFIGRPIRARRELKELQEGIKEALKENPDLLKIEQVLRDTVSSNSPKRVQLEDLAEKLKPGRKKPAAKKPAAKKPAAKKPAAKKPAAKKPAAKKPAAKKPAAKKALAKKAVAKK